MEHNEYVKASAFWTDKDKAGKKADPQTVYEDAVKLFLANKNCALATGYGDFVRCTPVDYTFHDGAFWIFTEGGMKFYALEHNKNVSLSIYDRNSDFGTMLSVQVMGKAELIEPYSDEYVRNAQLRKIPIETLKKLTYPMYLLKITPVEIILLDTQYKKQGLDNRQLWKSQDN